MPARTRKIYHKDKDKALIRASYLLNRLTDFVDGKCELSAAQVNAARVVIAKAIPDLKAITVSGDENKPLVVNYKWLS